MGFRHSCMFSEGIICSPVPQMCMLKGSLWPNLWSEYRHEVTRHDVTSLEHQTRNMSLAIFSSPGLYLCSHTSARRKKRHHPSQFVQPDSTHPEKNKIQKQNQNTQLLKCASSSWMPALCCTYMYFSLPQNVADQQRKSFKNSRLLDCLDQGCPGLVLDTQTPLDWISKWFC